MWQIGKGPEDKIQQSSADIAAVWALRYFFRRYICLTGPQLGHLCRLPSRVIFKPAPLQIEYEAPVHSVMRSRPPYHGAPPMIDACGENPWERLESLEIKDHC